MSCSSFLCVMFVCACLWHSTRCCCLFLCIEKRKRCMSGVFNSPHGQRGGDKEEKGKKEENWKLLRQPQKQESRNRMGRGKRLQEIILLSLSFTHSFSVTGTIFVILPTGNRNGIKEKKRQDDGVFLKADKIKVNSWSRKRRDLAARLCPVVPCPWSPGDWPEMCSDCNLWQVVASSLWSLGAVVIVARLNNL